MLEDELRYRVDVRDEPTPDGGAGGSCTIRLRDAVLNYSFSDQLKGALKDICTTRIDRGARRFVIDLSAVNVMDSCGLSVLIGLRKVVSAAGGRMVVVATSPILLRLFTITRLDGVFEIVRDEAAAAAAFERAPRTAVPAA
ncbi:MAG: STAS domain-containing protein [Planctomycetes bacterium]|nr:STAS domain-containing protein [Planctomycetota bacterium]